MRATRQIKFLHIFINYSSTSKTEIPFSFVNRPFHTRWRQVGFLKVYFETGGYRREPQSSITLLVYVSLVGWDTCPALHTYCAEPSPAEPRRPARSPLISDLRWNQRTDKTGRRVGLFQTFLIGAK